MQREGKGPFDERRNLVAGFGGKQAIVVLILFLATCLIWVRDARAQSTRTEQIEDQPAEKVFHNIQVLKGMRAGDLQGAMSFIASSLGVDCDHCHRGDDFGKDLTKEKSRAREMMRMVREINESTFRGEDKVNCFTCHQGHQNPISLAPISLPAPTERKKEAPTAGPAPGGALPTVEEVLNHYVQALGGQAALDGVKSRIIRTAPLKQENQDSRRCRLCIKRCRRRCWFRMNRLVTVGGRASMGNGLGPRIRCSRIGAY